MEGVAFDGVDRIIYSRWELRRSPIRYESRPRSSAACPFTGEAAEGYAGGVREFQREFRVHSRDARRAHVPPVPLKIHAISRRIQRRSRLPVFFNGGRVLSGDDYPVTSGRHSSRRWDGHDGALKCDRRHYSTGAACRWKPPNGRPPFHSRRRRRRRRGRSRETRARCTRVWVCAPIGGYARGEANTSRDPRDRWPNRREICVYLYIYIYISLSLSLFFIYSSVRETLRFLKCVAIRSTVNEFRFGFSKTDGRIEFFCGLEFSFLGSSRLLRFRFPAPISPRPPRVAGTRLGCCFASRSQKARGRSSRGQEILPSSSHFLSLDKYIPPPPRRKYITPFFSEHTRACASRPGEEEPLPLFRYLPFRYRTARKHARTHATRAQHTPKSSLRNTRESVGRGLASVDRGALDQQPSRESDIAATKREGTRPLVFIRGTASCPPRTTVSLFRGASPTPNSRRTRVREDTHERSGKILILTSGPEEACGRDHGRSFVGPPLIRVGCFLKIS